MQCQDDGQRKLYSYFLSMSMLLNVSNILCAAPQNGAVAILDRWRAQIRAEVAAEEIPKANNGATATLRITCSAHLHGISDPYVAQQP